MAEGVYNESIGNKRYDFYARLKEEYPDRKELIDGYQRLHESLDNHFSPNGNTTSVDELRLDSIKSSELATARGTLLIILGHSYLDPRSSEVVACVAEYYKAESTELSERVRLLSSLEALKPSLKERVFRWFRRRLQRY